MKILMTGATGLIGKEVGKRLVEAGHSLVVMSRHPESASRELPFPATVFKWAGAEQKFPAEALRDVEGVIHLAGEPLAEGRWSAERKRRIRDSRIMGTRRLVEAISADEGMARNLKAFVLGSAVGFYGDRKDEILDESSSLGEGFLAEVVRDWEAEADALRGDARTAHVRVAKVRTGVVFARHGGAIAKMLPIFSHGLGGRLGRGDQWMSWIHLDDIARLFVFCVENRSVEGVINGVAPEAIQNRAFTKDFARALGRPAPFPAPKAALRLILGEMSSAVLGSQRVVPRKALDLGFQFKYSDFAVAARDLADPYRAGQCEVLAEQWVPRPPEEIFPFFCAESNLERITPPFLGFTVLGKSTQEIEEGTLIDYKLSLHGLPMRWRTRIESWKPNTSFVDTQLSGPYRKWHHTHEFLPFAGGTLLRDRVLYKLPMGWLGDVAARWKVSRDVAAIFAYRRKIIDEMFGVPRA